MSSSDVNLENVRITLEDISVASSENLEISENSRYVEIGQLYELWQNRTAAIASGNYSEEVDQIISKLHHENIIPFYSNDDQYNEYAIIGTLSNYLQERKNFTWAQRLRSCIGIAKGLSYLHSGVGDHGRVIHGNLQSYNVLLNENLEAKICGLVDSVLVRGNQPRPEIYRDASPGPYIYDPTSSDPDIYDPVYLESNILNIESDIYSYGILMFDILNGRQADVDMVRRFYGDGPEQLIDPCIVDNVDRRSFHMFIETAYKCISFNIKDRPTIDEIVKTIEEAMDVHNQQVVSAIATRKNPADSLENFRVSLEEIQEATNNFSEETQIRKGYFNVVYKGHFSDRLQIRTAAIKKYVDHEYEIQIHKGILYSELEFREN